MIRDEETNVAGTDYQKKNRRTSSISMKNGNFKSTNRKVSIKEPHTAYSVRESTSVAPTNRDQEQLERIVDTEKYDYSSKKVLYVKLYI